jgi:hypothetical protein
MIIEPKREILIGPLLRIAWTRCWAARDHFLRLAVVPVLGQFLIVILLGNSGTMDQINPASAGADPTIVLQGALFAACSGALAALFAVNWIRQLTLGAPAVPGLGMTLRPRLLRFMLLMIAAAASILLPAMIVMPLAVILLQDPLAAMLASGLLCVLLLAALLARISPAWIGIAIDARISVATAWKRTAGQGFKLLVALLAVEVGTMLAAQLLRTLLYVIGMLGAAPFASTLLFVVLSLAGLALQIAVLVSAFPQFLRETV